MFLGEIMSVNNISPIDGRYKSKTLNLIDYYSEKALIKYRVLAEIKYLIFLTGYKKLGLKGFSKDELNILGNIMDITDEDALTVKEIENKGYKNYPATNHDVKAIEYFIKDKLSETSLKDKLEMVHFALTSEDVNNISYSLMLRDGFNTVIFPKLLEIYESLYNTALNYKNTAMLARTHGQPASPTTFGKEMLVFVNRLKDEIKILKDIRLLIKLNGATGNYNAHNIAFGDIDWQDFSVKFSKEFEGKSSVKNNKFYSRDPLVLDYNPVTTQIEPHDSFARIFDSVKRINNILLDFSMDIWRYISDNWIKQKPVKGEIGSSAMPHKVNPIDFENAEGNLGIANALFQFFANKLSISRLQRDLSDSTVLRNIGVAFSHSYIAYQSILKGLSKIEINKEEISKELNNYPEVMAEAYQTVLRVSGVKNPYELLKDITRGKKVTLDDFTNLAKKLNIDDKIKKKLLTITPENYSGLAEKIVESFNPKIY